MSRATVPDLRRGSFSRYEIERSDDAVVTVAQAAALASDAGILRFAWLIVLLPLLSSFLIVFFGKRMPGGGAELGIPAVAA